MDLSSFRKADWLMVGGGAGFLIFGTFFDWVSFSRFGVDFSDGNAFDFFFRGTIPWILIVGSGVLAFLIAGGVVKRDLAPWPLILLAATALGTLLNFLLVLVGPSKSGVDFDRGIGLWLSFVAAVVALVGAVLGFKESGGDMSDLRDVNKLKAAFGGTGATGTTDPPPPPPPPADSPPPPA
jgi:hypothetical protein